MKKIFAIFAILMMLSGVSMAATMSDADLAAVTGQSGVTIDISSLQMALRLGTFTYGDLDGFTTAGSLGTDFTDPGYLNVAFWPVPMHIGIGDIELIIDLGTSATTSVTAVNIGITIGAPITLDAIVCNVDLAQTNGAATDYVGNETIGSSYGPSFSPVYYTASNAALSNNIGVVGISLVSVTIPSLNVQISAH
jgi:hypothetical protein